MDNILMNYIYNNKLKYNSVFKKVIIKNCFVLIHVHEYMCMLHQSFHVSNVWNGNCK